MLGESRLTDEAGAAGTALIFSITLTVNVTTAVLRRQNKHVTRRDRGPNAQSTKLFPNARNDSEECFSLMH